MREDRQIEALFCGRGWGEAAGAHIALHVPDIDDQRWVRGFNARDQVEKEHHGMTWGILMLEIGEDEIIINQKRREKADPPPVGGPRSQAVARMLQDQDFCMWLEHASLWGQGKTWRLENNRTLKERDALVKSICGFKSKIELDNGNEQAWNQWERQFHRPFIQWCKRNG